MTPSERASLQPLFLSRHLQRKLRTALERLVAREAFTRHASEFAERVAGIDGAKNAVESFERVKSKLRR